MPPSEDDDRINALTYGMEALLQEAARGIPEGLASEGIRPMTSEVNPDHPVVYLPTLREAMGSMVEGMQQALELPGETSGTLALSNFVATNSARILAERGVSLDPSFGRDMSFVNASPISGERIASIVEGVRRFARENNVMVTFPPQVPIGLSAQTHTSVDREGRCGNCGLLLRFCIHEEAMRTTGHPLVGRNIAAGYRRVLHRLSMTELLEISEPPGHAFRTEVLNWAHHTLATLEIEGHIGWLQGQLQSRAATHRHHWGWQMLDSMSARVLEERRHVMEMDWAAPVGMFPEWSEQPQPEHDFEQDLLPVHTESVDFRILEAMVVASRTPPSVWDLLNEDEEGE